MSLIPHPDYPAARRPRFIACLIGTIIATLLLSVPGGFAAETGTVTGRVFNPATGEYVRNAEVRIDGTDIVTYTAEGGQFQLNNVPAGESPVSVSYTGYRTTRATIPVSAGQTASHDFNLISSLEKGDTVVLDTFTVSSDREGNAKAIMAQRSNMNVSNSVASDIFGDVSEGNVGEFLKFLPGVDLEYVDAEGRSPRLGGLDPQYVGVTIDGAKLASADNFADYNGFINGSSGSGSRSMGFEQMSINNIESVEISRTTSADMDANAPAGTINLKTKRAFDRKGRSISAQASLSANSDDFTFSKTNRPGDHESRLVRPSFKFSYSEAFLDHRLGVIFGYGRSKVLVEQQSVNYTFDRRSPTTADSRSIVLTQINFGDGPKLLDRDSAALNLDFKATPNLVFSLSTLYNTYAGKTYSRSLSFRLSNTGTNATSGRSTVLGDGLVDIQTNGLANNSNHYVNITGGQNFDKHTESYTITPRFEYTRNNLLVDGTLSYSNSHNHYQAISSGFVTQQTVSNLNVNFAAKRSDMNSPEWTITQTGGPDWSDLRNFTNPAVNNTDSRGVLDKIIQGEVNARYTLPVSTPTFIKVGVKTTNEHRTSYKRNDYNDFAYVGPDGGATGSFVDFPSTRQIVDTTWGGINALTLTNASLPAYPSREALGQAFVQHPEWFVRTNNAADYFSAFYEQNRDFKESVPATYVMGNTRIGKWQIQGGVRWEGTRTESKEYDPLTAAQVVAAGYSVDGDGIATTNPGVDYQYGTNPKITRKSSYDDFFPSISAKYNINPNLQFQLGYNKAIARAPINALAGVLEIDDIGMEVNLPNVNLQPERSNNYVARLAYYFEPVGSLTFLVQQNEISNLISPTTRTGAEFGYPTNSPYYDYEVNSYFNSPTLFRYRNYELGYNQQLSFLPGPLGGLNVNLSYSHSEANQVRRGLVPNKVTGGLGWTYSRLSVRLGAIYSADTVYQTDTRYRKKQIKLDLSGTVRLTQQLSLFFYGKNITNEPLELYDMADPASGAPALLQSYRNYGTSWEFGIKGNF